LVIPGTGALGIPTLIERKVNRYGGPDTTKPEEPRPDRPGVSSIRASGLVAESDLGDLSHGEGWNIF
jgi:hypothetical protein